MELFDKELSQAQSTQSTRRYEGQTYLSNKNYYLLPLPFLPEPRNYLPDNMAVPPVLTIQEKFITF